MYQSGFEWNYRIDDENGNTVTYADSLVVAESEAYRLAGELYNNLMVVRCADDTIVISASGMELLCAGK